MSKNIRVQEYPIMELKSARAVFIHGWHRAMRSDPLLYSIYNRHYRFPPTLSMKNCITYPFTKEDQVLHMPTLPKASRQETSVNSSIDASCNSNLNVSTQCVRLAESILRDPDTTTRESSVGHVYYECDVCSFNNPDCAQTHAHLKSAQHCSASLLGFVEETAVVADDDQSTDLTADPTTSNQLVLLKARELYNAQVPSLGWLTDKVAILCPSCHLIFPDKLMCAYHHQSQHDGHQAKHSTGVILAVRRITINANGKCSTCMTSFDNLKDFTNHWLSNNSNRCQSPFLPVRLYQPTEHVPNQLVQAYCQLCRVSFARVTPTAQSSHAQSFPKRKRRSDGTLLANKVTEACVDSWSNGFARFMVNHAKLHLTDSCDSGATCTIHLRFVQLDKHRKAHLYPPYRHVTDEDLLLFCIHECKRLLTHLNGLRMTRRASIRRTKADLSRLLNLARTLDKNLP